MAESPDTPLQDKLGIREGTRMTSVNAPAAFRESLGLLPLDVTWANRVRPPLDLIVAFHNRRATMLANWPALVAAIEADGAIWIAWPKKASGVTTDLDENIVRDELIKNGWSDSTVCAIDDTWTALCLVRRVDRRPKKTAATAKPARLRKTRPGSHR